MPRTLFCLRCTHATGAADVHVTHQASTKSPLTFKHFPTKQEGLSVDVENSVLKARSQEVTACFMSASLSNHFPIKCFWRGAKRWKSPGSVLKTKLDYLKPMDLRLWITLSKVSISHLVIFNSSGPQRSPGWNAIRNKRWLEAHRHHLPKDSCYGILPRPNTSLGTMLGRIRQSLW